METRPKRPRKPRRPEIYKTACIELPGPSVIDGSRCSATLEELVDALPIDVGLDEVVIASEPMHDGEYGLVIRAIRRTVVEGASVKVAEHEIAMAKWVVEMVAYRTAMDAWRATQDANEAARLRQRLAALECD